MSFRISIALCLLLSFLLGTVPTAKADIVDSSIEQAMSETLDQWREGHYDQLYERLSHRGKTSKEKFVAKMKKTTIRPACCWQKIENFKVLNKKKAVVTVYAKIGLEGMPVSTDSCTREFKMYREGEVWKMQLNDIFSIAGTTGKKSKQTHHKKTRKNTSHN